MAEAIKQTLPEKIFDQRRGNLSCDEFRQITSSRLWVQLREALRVHYHRVGRAGTWS